MNVGQRLKAIRELAEISTKDLDRLAKISPGHTWTLEKAETASAEAKTLDAVAGVLGISLDYLVRGEGPEPDVATIKAAVGAARELREKEKLAGVA